MKNSNRVICIGDSLAAHRDEDFISSKKRWPKLLEDSFNVELLNLSKPYRTTNDLKLILKLNLNPQDILIIQLGIVDCAPRRFNKIENSIIYRLPSILKIPILNYYLKRRTQSIDRAYVNEKIFKKNIINTINKHKGEILFVKILPCSKTLRSKNPLIENSINIYNNLLDELSEKFKNFKTIEVDKTQVDNLTLDDGYHLNLNGHKFIANLIINEIEKIKTQD